MTREGGERSQSLRASTERKAHPAGRAGVPAREQSAGSESRSKRRSRGRKRPPNGGADAPEGEVELAAVRGEGVLGADGLLELSGGAEGELAEAVGTQGFLHGLGAGAEAVGAEAVLHSGGGKAEFAAQFND